MTENRNPSYPSDYGEYLEAEFDMASGNVKRSYEEWKSEKQKDK